MRTCTWCSAPLETTLRIGRPPAYCDDRCRLESLAARKRVSRAEVAAQRDRDRAAALADVLSEHLAAAVVRRLARTSSPG